MRAVRAMARVREFFARELGLAATIIGIAPLGDGWRATAEAVVEADYMRERAQRDLVAVFEVTLDQALHVVAFERKEVRVRGTPTPGPC